MINCNVQIGESPFRLVARCIGLLVGMMYCAGVLAQPQVSNIYPTQGRIGNDLDITVSGSGFNSNTKLSMYLDSGNERLVTGSLEDLGQIGGIDVKGNTAYLVTAWELHTVDVSQPSNPKLIASMPLPEIAGGIVVFENYAYISDQMGIRIVDIENAAQPIEVAAIDLDGKTREIKIVGSYAYVAGNGLYIIDVSNPVNAFVVGTLEPPAGLLTLEVSGNYAYVAPIGHAVMIVDISSPSNPRFLDTPAFADSIAWTQPWDMASDGDYLYVNSQSFIDAFDISSPAEPVKLTNSLLLRDFAYETQVRNNRLFIANNSGMQVIDFSDPMNPREEGSLSSASTGFTIQVSGNYAYLGGKFGLIIIEANSLSPYQLQYSDKSLRGAWGIQSTGTGLYVSAAGSVYKLSEADPSQRTLIVPSELFGPIYEFEVVGSDLYAHFSGYMSRIDISDPSNPVLLATAEDGYTNYTVRDIKQSDNYIYVNSNNSFQIFDVSQTSEISLIQTMVPENSQIFRSFDIADSFLYLSDGQKVSVFDIATPSSPVLADTLDTRNEQIAISNGLAYIAGSWGLQIYNISNPANPVQIGSIGSQFFNPKDIQAIDDFVYVLSGGLGIVTIDVSDPASPYMVGQVDTPGWKTKMAILNGAAWVADGRSGLSVVPLPVMLDSVNVISASKIEVELPSPSIEGNYTLRVINESDFTVEYGAVTFSSELQTFSKPVLVSEPNVPSVPAPSANSVSKAIIVAGGGPYPGNNLWPSTIKSADFAYRALLYQGYTRENIYYLSPDTENDADGDGKFNDVDAVATTENLQYALLNWASEPAAPAYELLVFIVDHGGNAQFRLNQTTLLSAQQLDGWLDAAQQNMPGKLMVIYDACQSGTFIPRLKAPSGKDRILITSAADENAFFINQGGLSFSFQFWTSVLSGGSVLDSYVFGRNMMDNYQTAQVDADGDGRANEKEDRQAIQGLTIGRGYIPASDKPLISFVSAPQTLNGEDSATFTASGIIDATGVQRVWATISRPDFDPGEKGDPVLDLPEVELLDPEGDNTWVGSYDKFDVIGNYTVTIHALNSNGFYSSPSELFPNTILVTQTDGLLAPAGIDTDGDGIPDSIDTDDDNDGVPDTLDYYPLVDSITGNLSSSEVSTYSVIRSELNLPQIDVVSVDQQGQQQISTYINVQLRSNPQCGETAFEVVGGTEIADSAILSDRDIAVSIFDTAILELYIPTIEVAAEGVFGGIFVIKYADITMSLYPECSPTALQVTGAIPAY